MWGNTQKKRSNNFSLTTSKQPSNKGKHLKKNFAPDTDFILSIKSFYAERIMSLYFVITDKRLLCSFNNLEEIQILMTQVITSPMS